MSKNVKFVVLILIAVAASVGLLFGAKYNFPTGLYLPLIANVFVRIWPFWLAVCVLEPLFCAGVARLTEGKATIGVKVGLLVLEIVGVALAALMLIPLGAVQIWIWPFLLAACVGEPLFCAGVARLTGGDAKTGAKFGLLLAVGVGLAALVLFPLGAVLYYHG